MTTVGLLHPGEMGSSVGACARAGGADVLWASENRSEATRQRAAAEQLHDVGTLEALVDASDIILSVCPPSSAPALAQAVADRGFNGIFVDGNAVNPTTAARIGETLRAVAARFVDGGIIGPPARHAGSTRIYLSGPDATEVAALFEAGPLEARILESGSASSLKMAFAAYTKGNAALALTVRALARAQGVEQALLEEWKTSLPQLAGFTEGAAKSTARKAWRFVGEMEEIAQTFADAGLADGFHRAAGETYAAYADLKDAEDPNLDDVIEKMLRRK